jgi:hypothetical protein
MNDNAIEAVMTKTKRSPNNLVNRSIGKAPQCPEKSIKQARPRPAHGRWRELSSCRYIQRRAAEHDGRVVTIGQLTLFSTETGDACIIDRDDHLALRLACQGDPEPSHIEVERALARSPSAIPFELAGQHRKRRVLGQFAMVVEIL